MFNFIHTYIIDNLLWTAGFWIFLPTMLILILGFYKSRILLYLAGGFLLFCIYFFRNPTREPLIPIDQESMISPADGVVLAIESVEDAIYGQRQRVSIFLSPFDVHVNWIPVAGIIEKMTYRPGAFLVAYKPKSSELNEQHETVITTKSGRSIIVRQIAGFIARRICWWIKEQDPVFRGEKYGMIRFGSRVDLLLDLETTISVKVGQRVVGGQTIIGRL